jgi:hypothetical protein
MPEHYARIVTLFTPDHLSRLDKYMRAHEFRTRSDALRNLIDRADIPGEPAQPEPEPEPEAQPEPMQPGMLPGENLPVLKLSGDELRDPITPLVKQRLQPVIDQTGRVQFDRHELVQLIFGVDQDSSAPWQQNAIRSAMLDLGWVSRTLRAGQPRGSPRVVYSPT